MVFMRRFHQVLLIGSFLPLCWFGMMAVHELGHVGGVLATGATIAKVVLHPLTISRTDASVNPSPLSVVWAGTIVGVILPVGLVILAKISKLGWAYLLRFFAGFCLIANGCYIGIGSFGGVGDAGDMLRHGSPMWCLWLFGLATVPLGLYLWNGLGPNFGLGSAQGKVDHCAAYVSFALLLLTLLLELAFSSTWRCRVAVGVAPFPTKDVRWRTNGGRAAIRTGKS
jgi:hypothetical protein